MPNNEEVEAVYNYGYSCLRELKFSNDAKQVIMKSMDIKDMDAFQDTSIIDFVKKFTLINSEADGTTLIFKKGGHCGKDPHQVGKEYQRVLKRGLSEIRLKLQGLELILKGRK